MVAKSSPPRKNRGCRPLVSAGAVVKMTEFEPTPERSRLEPVLAKVTEVKVRLEPLPDIVMTPSMELTARAPVTSFVVLPTRFRVPPVIVTAPVLRSRLLLLVIPLSRVSVPPAVVAMLPAVQAPLAPPRIVVPRLAVSVPVARLAAVRIVVPVPAMVRALAPVPAL